MIITKVGNLSFTPENGLTIDGWEGSQESPLEEKNAENFLVSVLQYLIDGIKHNIKNDVMPIEFSDSCHGFKEQQNLEKNHE